MKGYIFAGMMGILLLISLPASPSFADGATIEMTRPSSLTIRYRESDDGNEPVSGAEFTVMRAAVPEESLSSSSISLRYRALFKENGKTVYLDASTKAAAIEKSLLSYYSSGGGSAGGAKGSSEAYLTKAVTDTNGMAYATGLPPGIYLVRETKAAKEHLPSAAFLAVVPFTREITVDGRRTMEWCYDASAEPKPVPCGDLVITKYVRGAGGDVKRNFHFVVRLNAEGSFHYRYSNGKEGSMKDGAVFKLHSGQSVVIDTIPTGTLFQVKEKEANKSGYKTQASGTSGRIVRTKQSRAIFLNTKQSPIKTPTPAPSKNNPETPVRRMGTAPVRTGDENDFLGWLSVFTCSLLAVILNMGNHTEAGLLRRGSAHESMTGRDTSRRPLQGRSTSKSRLKRDGNGRLYRGGREK